MISEQFFMSLFHLLYINNIYICIYDNEQTYSTDTFTATVQCLYLRCCGQLLRTRKVIDKQSRQPVAYANVVVAGIPGKGASTDSLGIFRIEQIPPGIYRFEATLIGYKSAVTSEYLVSASTPFIEIEIEEDENMLSAIVVTPSPFRKR